MLYQLCLQWQRSSDRNKGYERSDEAKVFHGEEGRFPVVALAGVAVAKAMFQILARRQRSRVWTICP